MAVKYWKAEYGDFDIETVVDIDLAIRPDAHESVGGYVEWHDVQRNAGRLCVRWLVSVDDDIVGSAYVGQSAWLPREVISHCVAVHPDHQNRGYGRALLERAEHTASEQGGDKAYTWADETLPMSMHFLEGAGYDEVDRGWESSLDLTRCDPGSLRSAIERVATHGIRIASATTFALERDDWKQELHRLYAEVERDVPGPFPIESMPFHDFETLSLGRRFLSDGFFVALDGENLVGLTEPQRVDGAPQEISQNLTGVQADYRGRGIAMALKSQSAIWAIDSGYTSIRTHNAQSNSSMLAVNRRLGFTPNHATIVYLKDL